MLQRESILKTVFGLIILFLLIALLQGCGPYLHRPIIKTNVGNHPALAVSADRRLVIANTDKKTVCAEPSPDAAQALLSIFSIGEEKTGTTGTKSQLGFTELLQTTPFQLFMRSQGVQFYRDSIFALCQMAMNRWISITPITTDTLVTSYITAMGKYYTNLEDYNRARLDFYYSQQKPYNETLKQYNEELVKATERYNTSPTTNNKSALDIIIQNKKQIMNVQHFLEPPPEPAYPIRTELEIAMQYTRRDAKEIIIEEVKNSELQKPLREMHAKLIKDMENAKNAQDMAVSKAKLEIMEKILKQLGIGIKTEDNGS